MSNSAINITAGTGTAVDTWLVGSDHQQIVVVRAFPAATATLTNVTSSATSVQLLASNTARLGAVIYNDSTSLLYVKSGTPKPSPMIHSSRRIFGGWRTYRAIRR